MKRSASVPGRVLLLSIIMSAPWLPGQEFSLLDGLYQGWLDDPDFRPIVDQDVTDGQHRNPDPVGRPEFFTTAYFHTPVAWPARSNRLDSGRWPSTASKARAGRCARSG